MNVCSNHAVVYSSSTCPACEAEARYVALRDSLAALVALLPGAAPQPQQVVEEVTPPKSGNKKLHCDARDELAARAILSSTRKLETIRAFVGADEQFHVNDLKACLGLDPNVRSRAIAPALRVLGCVESSIGGVWRVTPEARRKITTYPVLF